MCHKEIHHDKHTAGRKPDKGRPGKSGKPGKIRLRDNGYFRKAVIVLLWIGAWTVISLAVDSKILLATPWDTAGRLLEMLGKASFYHSVARSLSRIALGFAAGLSAALLLAAASWRFRLLEDILSPAVSLAKTVPVASFVVILLIWWGSSFLAAAICFLVVLPGIYISTLEGLKSTDRRLLEMARSFCMPLRNRFFYIYRPALKPFLCGSLRLALGMCWKSGVAAEIIGTPEHSIGEGLYMSKVYLDTAGVFAWTAVIVAASILFEKAVLWLAGRFFAWEPPCGSARVRAWGHPAGVIRMDNVEKSFGDCVVLKGCSAVYEPGGTYYLTSPSGSGKTTRLHLLAGLLEPDAGEITAPSSVGMVFQEDRLCEDYDAVKNVELVTGDRERAKQALLELLPPEALHKPCLQLSGGMKRRVAIVRAAESGAEALLLDEPFTGLDAGTRERAGEYIERHRAGRTLIVATHISPVLGAQEAEKS